ncbi:flagellar hook-length control protein FliK [Bacillus atrophaeus]|uniref:flagellar hook-length control protein FliK n=1 Tax=Bacillus atrophaeus TaxID=1452 RepID=UPI00227FE9F6|nr:flagellar hook-length control protein FliK [Bacillus atrophaeus]MCY8498737.1 flagellar hook-length control protein FliK [Bacillus atrophaeus]MCY8505564.1 flagellar hook-length control protein FliK [Bacillus atrophaeus]MCY8813116.1 flagellar hook-length control protein FliK [Bacillus atrophaeus]MCY8820158.1 flagellar hook-length control protein FliK [Bacillus atrophaeus]MCY8830853.1 flagellar hook-length control protein FliK [Bacillus atrophaeus]
MKLLELAGTRMQTATGAAAQNNKSEAGFFQNWLLSEIGSVKQTGEVKDTSTSDQQLLENALKKIGDWLKASPEDQEKQTAELLQTLNTLKGKQADEAIVPMLENLMKMIKAILPEQTEMQVDSQNSVSAEYAAVTEADEMTADGSSDEKENETEQSTDGVLIFIQTALYQLLKESDLSKNKQQAQAIYKNGDSFLAALKEKGASDQLIEELKQQVFTKQESASKLYTMSNAELKSFRSLMEQITALPQKGTKDWNLAESELKAFLLSKSSDSSQEGKRVSLSTQSSAIERENRSPKSIQAADSKQGIHMLFSGHRSSGIQSMAAQLSAEPLATESKPLTDQVISAWKQMKYTPFGRSTGSFTIRLNPEHLGFVTIKLTNENGMFQSKIIASSQSAKELLEQHLPQLKQSLPNMAVQVDRFTLPIQSGDQPVYGQLSDEQRQQHDGQKQQKQKQQTNEFGDLLDEISHVELEEEE